MNPEQQISMFKAELNSESKRIIAEELSLNIFNGAKVIDALCEGILDKDSGVRDICSRALATAPIQYKSYVGKKMAPMITSEDIEIRNLVGDVLVKLGDYSTEALLPFLSDISSDTRQFCLDIFSKTTPSDIDAKIIPLLQDNNRNIKFSAVELLGNIQSSTSINDLISLYKSASDPDLYPIIIESLGKIGGHESEQFLINIFKNTDDDFIKISIIDALAAAGESHEICTTLIDEMPKVSEEFQKIILKAVYAISFRQNLTFQLPNEYRTIAYSCINDDDYDLRVAGVLALGDNYNQEDISYLLKEIDRNSDDLQQIIIVNLIINSDLNIIRKFADSLINLNLDDNAVTNFIENTAIIKESTAGNKLRIFLHSLFFKILNSDKYKYLSVIKIISDIDPEYFSLLIQESINSDDISVVISIIDIIGDLPVNNYNDILNFIADKFPQLKDRVISLTNVLANNDINIESGI